MKVGYVRIPKQEQNEELQIDALKLPPCREWQGLLSHHAINVASGETISLPPWNTIPII
jgi:hypothetical protein